MSFGFGWVPTDFTRCGGWRNKEKTVEFEDENEDKPELKERIIEQFVRI